MPLNGPCDFRQLDWFLSAIVHDLGQWDCCWSRMLLICIRFGNKKGALEICSSDHLPVGFHRSEICKIKTRSRHECRFDSCRLCSSLYTLPGQLSSYTPHHGHVRSFGFKFDQTNHAKFVYLAIIHRVEKEQEQNLILIP